MPESIQVAAVPAQNMDGQTHLVGERDGAFVRVAPQSLNAVFIPDLRLQIIKADIVGNNGKFRPKNSILVKLEYPADALFLQYNPRIVLLRQSGNNSLKRYYNENTAPTPDLVGTVRGYRQRTRKYAYTRPVEGVGLIGGDSRYFAFPFGSPDMQRYGNATSFVLMEKYAPADATQNVYFTVDRYLAHFADITVNEAPALSSVNLRRGGLAKRRFTFIDGQPYNGYGRPYASANIGFQLVTDAGKSNIVYVKVRVLCQLVDVVQNEWNVVKSWSLMPNI